MARPFAVPVMLADTDREVLLGWSRRPKTAQAMALRARIVLAAAESGLTNTAIAAQVGTTTNRDRYGLHASDSRGIPAWLVRSDSAPAASSRVAQQVPLR